MAVNLLNDIQQVCVVTRDLRPTINTLRETLGLGAFKAWGFKSPHLLNTTLRNKPEPYTMGLAVTWVGNMQLEVIQPTGGHSLYQEYLDRHNHAGLQHFIMDRGTTSYSGVGRKLAELGFPLMQEARTNVGVQAGPVDLPPLPSSLATTVATHFGYTDTADTLKTSIEIAEFPLGLSPRLSLRLAQPGVWVGEQVNFDKLPADSLISDIRKLYLLVNDLDAALAHWQKLQAAPVPQADVPLTDMVTGAASRARLAFITLKRTQIVLAQPVEGEDVFARLLRQRGEGGQILGAVPRYTEPTELIEKFGARGWSLAFAVNVQDEVLRYFTHPDAPFAVEVSLPT
jgi:hypothetical protein